MVLRRTRATLAQGAEPGRDVPARMKEPADPTDAARVNRKWAAGPVTNSRSPAATTVGRVIKRYSSTGSAAARLVHRTQAADHRRRPVARLGCAVPCRPRTPIGGPRGKVGPVMLRLDLSG